MTISSHEPVMEVLHASLDPASHSAARTPLDLPTGRLIAAAAHADAEEQDMKRLSMLASGLAMAAWGVTVLLASHSDQSPEELLESMQHAAQRHGSKDTPAMTVIGGMLKDRGQAGTTILGETFARNQVEFFNLLVDLAGYCGTCIMTLEQTFSTPREETLQDLEEMLKASP